jgi:peroxiredoxin
LHISKAKLDASGVQILAISTDNLRGPAAFAASQEFSFPLLYTELDPSIPQEYGVFNLFGDGLASASMFLIDEQGEVAWQSIGENYRHQVEISEIVEQVGLLN